MIHWVDMAFVRWGKWVQLGRGRGSAGMAVRWDGVGGGGVAGAIIPIREIDTSRTHDWVLSLPENDQHLLYNVYCTPQTARENAIKLKKSLRTLYAHLHRLQASYARALEERKNNC
jgi:hypothetical protein